MHADHQSWRRLCRLADVGLGSGRFWGAFFLAHDRPFAVAASGSAASNVVVVQRQALAALIPAGTELALAKFDADNPIIGLIKGYLPMLSAESELSDPRSLDVMGQHVVDLIALLLRASRDASEVIAGRGLKAARKQAVLNAIARDLDNPALSAEMVGRELGISARQVHRLLEETPKTFYEHVLERRLCRARELLLSPAGLSIPIADVARRCGFVAVSHFGRTFAVRFGTTPSAVRSKALH